MLGALQEFWPVTGRGWTDSVRTVSQSVPIYFPWVDGKGWGSSHAQKAAAWGRASTQQISQGWPYISQTALQQ